MEERDGEQISRGQLREEVGYGGAGTLGGVHGESTETVVVAKKTGSSTKNSTLYMSAAISFIINVIGYFTISKQNTAFHFYLFIGFPVLLFYASTAILLILKGILHGKTALGAWGDEDAKEMLHIETSRFRIMLLKLYILIEKPVLIWGYAFVGGCGVFYWIVRMISGK